MSNYYESLGESTPKEICEAMVKEFPNDTSKDVVIPITQAYLHASLNKELLKDQRKHQHWVIKWTRFLVFANWAVAIATIISVWHLLHQR